MIASTSDSDSAEYLSLLTDYTREVGAEGIIGVGGANALIAAAIAKTCRLPTPDPPAVFLASHTYYSRRILEPPSCTPCVLCDDEGDRIDGESAPHPLPALVYPAMLSTEDFGARAENESDFGDALRLILHGGGDALKVHHDDLSVSLSHLSGLLDAVLDRDSMAIRTGIPSSCMDRGTIVVEEALPRERVLAETRIRYEGWIQAGEYHLYSSCEHLLVPPHEPLGDVLGGGTRAWAWISPVSPSHGESGVIGRCNTIFEEISTRLIRKGFDHGLFSVTFVVEPNFRVAHIGNTHASAVMDLVYKRTMSISITELMLLVATGVPVEESTVRMTQEAHGAQVRLTFSSPASALPTRACDVIDFEAIRRLVRQEFDAAARYANDEGAAEVMEIEPQVDSDAMLKAGHGGEHGQCVVIVHLFAPTRSSLLEAVQAIHKDLAISPPPPSQYC